MAYKIIITPDAIAQAVKSHRNTSQNDELIESIARLYNDVQLVVSNPEIVFDHKDEYEVERGGNYAFDELLESFVAAGKKITIPHLIKHLKTRGCQHPHQMIALFLQGKAQFQFHIGGSILNHFLMTLGGSLPPQKGEEDEEGAKKANFKIEIQAGKTTLRYEDSISIPTISHSGIVMVEAGTVQAAISLNENNQLTLKPVQIILDDQAPEIRKIISSIQQNAPHEAGSQAMVVDAAAIQARQDRVFQASLANASPVQATKPKTRFQAQNIVKVIAISVLTGIGLACAYAGVVMTTLAIIATFTLAPLGIGLVIGAAAFMGILATCAAVLFGAALMACLTKTTPAISKMPAGKPLAASNSPISDSRPQAVSASLKANGHSAKAVFSHQHNTVPEKEIKTDQSKSMSSFFKLGRKRTKISVLDPLPIVGKNNVCAA